MNLTPGKTSLLLNETPEWEYKFSSLLPLSLNSRLLVSPYSFIITNPHGTETETHWKRIFATIGLVNLLHHSNAKLVPTVGIVKGGGDSCYNEVMLYLMIL